MGARYDAYQRAKLYLRQHPQASDADVAAFAGIKLAFPEEADTLRSARSDLALELAAQVHRQGPG